MKKIICTALLIIGFAPECGAMHTMKKITYCLFDACITKKNAIMNDRSIKLFGVLAPVVLGNCIYANSKVSMDAGFIDGFDARTGYKDFDEDEAAAFNRTHKYYALGLAVCYRFITRHFFASNCVLQCALYGKEYMRGKKERAGFNEYFKKLDSEREEK